MKILVYKDRYVSIGAYTPENIRIILENHETLIREKTNQLESPNEWVVAVRDGNLDLATNLVWDLLETSTGIIILDINTQPDSIQFEVFDIPESGFESSLLI